MLCTLGQPPKMLPAFFLCPPGPGNLQMHGHPLRKRGTGSLPQDAAFLQLALVGTQVVVGLGETPSLSGAHAWGS